MAALAALYGAYGVNAARRIGAGMGDFRHFFCAARAMSAGQDPYQSGTHGYLYPPLLAFLMQPVAALGLTGAGWVMLALNVAMFGAATVIGVREMAARLGAPARRSVLAGAALLATLVMADKIKGELQQWQTDVIVQLMVTVGLSALEGAPAVTGLALGLAFNIKFLPVVFLPYLVFRRRWAAAGWFVVGAACFSFLPAVQTGWHEDLHQLSDAYSGVMDLLGLPAGEIAKRNAMDAGFSFSITSAAARLVERMGLGGEHVALGAAGAVGGLCLAWAAWSYRVAGAPLAWAKAEEGVGGTQRALIGLEWAGLIVFFLAFSPQTNPRHASMLLLPCLAGAVLLISERAEGRAAWGVAAGLVLLALGLDLPPASHRFGPAIAWWRDVAGPSWCMLAMYALVIRAGVKRAVDLGGGSGTRSGGVDRRSAGGREAVQIREGGFAAGPGRVR